MATVDCGKTNHIMVCTSAYHYGSDRGGENIYKIEWKCFKCGLQDTDFDYKEGYRDALERTEARARVRVKEINETLSKSK